ncbi:hypothetical protein NKH84_05430 [Mesorhizobium sp. M0902]|uniref:hypothetical protein n=1 Tax=unclassified Mesorhizobium TaxID=325217 RepID=UPI00333701AF
MHLNADVLNNMPAFRSELIRRFTWMIHSTPASNLTSIRQLGLVPNQDAPPSPEVRQRFGHGKIVCLHPLGSKFSPKGAASTITFEHGQELKLVSLAIDTRDLPNDLGLDFSYSWQDATNHLAASTKSAHETAGDIAHMLGSVVSFNTIAPDKIRVFANGSAPASPLTWPPLLCTPDSEVIRHW